jgi:hypothetical protein
LGQNTRFARNRSARAQYTILAIRWEHDTWATRHRDATIQSITRYKSLASHVRKWFSRVRKITLF